MNGPAPEDTNPASASPSTPILVVEDNAIMSQILGKILNRLGASYKVVRNGLEAIEAVQQGSFSLVLMDIMMPGMDGIEATRRIRRLSGSAARVPIVAVTGNMDVDDIEKYYDAGMDGHVKKPVGLFALRKLLETHLGIESKIEAQEKVEAAIVFAGDDDDELSALNWETLNEYGAILKKRLPMFLRDYLRAGPDLLSDISMAIAEGDAERVQFMTHKLKSTSLIFGAESVSDLAAQLEILAKVGDLQSAPAIFQELHVCYERTQHVLRKKLVLLHNFG